MWSLFDNDCIKKEIEWLKEKTRKNTLQSREIPKFIFICGQQILNDAGNVKSDEELTREKNKRYHIMRELMNSRLKIGNYNSYNNILCIISEQLYREGDIIDLLTFEELLAELSDEIILIMESFGTACELGAFSLDDNLMKKLFVINEEQHKDSKSFISNGPIRKVIDNDEFKVIFVAEDYNEFKSDFKLKTRIRELSEMEIPFKPNLDEESIDLKYLIYELLNIIEVFQPLTKDELFVLYKRFKGFTRYSIKNENKHKIKNPTNIVDLMIRLGIVKKNLEYLIMSNDITSYNALFNINIKQLSEVRNKIISKMYKYNPERMQVISSESDRANE